MEATVGRAAGGDPRVSGQSSTHPARRSGEIGFLTFVVLLGLALRGARLGFQPLWWDEGYSAWFATHSLARMAALTAEDIHPPLYYALLHLWTRVAGAGPLSLRLLSVMAGVAAIPLMFAAARRVLGSRRAALIAAGLLAVNPLHVFYSQEVRMYGLVALLSTGVLWAAWEVLHGAGSRRAALSYVALAVAALYTQYYAVFLPIGLTLYAAWRWRGQWRRLAAWLGLQALVAVLYLPWVLYAGPRLVLYVSHKVVADADRPLGLLAYLARHLAAFAGGHGEGPLAGWWPLALLLLIPVLGGLAVAWRRGRPVGEADRPTTRPAIGMLATVLLVSLLLGWAVGLRYPFFPERGERLLLLALPAFVMLAAAGLHAWLPSGQPKVVPTGGRPTTSEAASEVSRRSETPEVSRRGWVFPAACAAFALVSAASLAAFYTVPRYADDDYRPLIARIVEQGLPEDTVFCVYPWQVGYWRSYAPAAGGASGPHAVLSPAPEWGAAVEDALAGALERGRVWFPAHLALGAILETQVEAALGGQAVAFANTWYGPGTRLSAWRRAALPDPAPPPGAQTPGAQTPGAQALARFEVPAAGALSLLGVTAEDAPAPAANAVTALSLAWQAAQRPPDLAVSVRLVDDLGQIWGQNDYEPLGSLGRAQAGDTAGSWQATDRLGLLVPAGTPPGRYRVELVVRPADAARPLQVQAGDGLPATGTTLYHLQVQPAGRPLGPESLPIAARRPIDLGDGIRFLGYTVDGGPVTPGAARRVNLFWQATAAPTADYTAFVQLLGADGAPAALWEAPPGAAYATSGWASGTLIRTQATLRVPATVADGKYRVIGGLFRAADGERLRTAGGDDFVSLGSLGVVGRGHVTALPQVEYAADARFGDAARLVGYDLSVTHVAPDASLDVTLHWEALAATDRPYTVFVQLLDEAGRAWGFGDAEPGAGAFPTTGWLAGEYLADAHSVLVMGDAPPGAYRLAVGLYDAETGKRLGTAEGGDQVTLSPPIVVP